MFALVDCNNFFVSCERVFRPDLINKPVVVLSNNDGCVIARSNEAKKLGINMGEPFFKIKALSKQHKVQIFSSNYSLYADFSARVMSIIQSEWDETDIYSIDEAFLDLRGIPVKNIALFCANLQKKILKCTGIPTTIGVAKTKTLAKIANVIAKKSLKIPVFSLTDNKNAWLKQLTVGEVWGVGWRSQEKLHAQHIHTAYDLSQANPRHMRNRYSTMMEKTVLELQEISCMTLDSIATGKSILSSRSFGCLQTDYQSLREAVSYHCMIAWEKLRQQDLKAKQISVFIRSNRFKVNLEQYGNTQALEFVYPTDNIKLILKQAESALKLIFKEGIQYKKCGILLTHLTDKGVQQYDLFSEVNEAEEERFEHTMKTIESINQKYGSQTIHMAAEGLQKKWAMKRALKSPNYTTQWNELAIVQA